MTRTVYISGPISSHPADGNRPAFDRAARELRARGFVAINPHEIFTEPPPVDRSPESLLAYWRRAMRVDVKHLMDCDAIVQLPGWRQSTGACREWDLACNMLGMEVLSLAPEVVKA